MVSKGPVSRKLGLARGDHPSLLDHIVHPVGGQTAALQEKRAQDFSVNRTSGLGFEHPAQCVGFQRIVPTHRGIAPGDQDKPPVAGAGDGSDVTREPFVQALCVRAGKAARVGEDEKHPAGLVKSFRNRSRREVRKH